MNEEDAIKHLVANEGYSEKKLRAWIKAGKPQDSKPQPFDTDEAAPAREPMGTLEATAHLAGESNVPWLHRILLPLSAGLRAFSDTDKGTRPFLAPFGSDVAAGNKAFDETQQEQMVKLKQAREDHPNIDTATEVGGMLFSPLRGAKMLSKVEKGGRIAKTLVNAGRGALASAERASGEGQSGADVAKAAGLGAASGGVGANLPTGRLTAPLANAAAGAASERAGRVLEGGPQELFTDPGAMVKPAAVSAGMPMLLAGVRAGRAKIRDKATIRGQNMAARESVPKEEIAKYRSGSAAYDVGDVATDAANEVLPELEARRTQLNKEFEPRAKEFIAQSGGKKIDASPMFQEISDLMRTQKLADGTPIPGDDLNSLRQFRDSIATEVKLPNGKTMFVPKDLGAEDLVKLRRAADEMGHQGQMAGKSDVAYRKISGLLRDTMIPAASPELAEFFAHHHDELTKLEQAHGAFVGKEESGVPDSQNIRTRAINRMARHGEKSILGRELDSQMEEAKTNFPATARPVNKVRAVRGREELRFNSVPIRVTQGGAGVSVSPGQISKFIDPALANIADPALGAAERGLETSPGPMMIEVNRRARKATKKKQETSP